MRTGTVKSAIGMGACSGPASATRIRVSAWPPIRSRRCKVGFEILKSLGLRHRGVNIISCPSCARQGFDVIETVATLEERLAHITTPMTPVDHRLRGERAGRGADDRPRLHRRRRRARGMVYVAGKPDHKIDNDGMVDHIVELVEGKVAQIQAAEAAAKAEAAKQAAE